MKSLEIMMKLSGNKDLVVGNAPLFSGKLTKYKIITDVVKEPAPKGWFVLAYKGVYVFRALEVIRSHMLCKDSKFRLLTTSNSIEEIQDYLNVVFNSNEHYYHDKEVDDLLEKLIGRKLTDATALLWLLETCYDGDLSYGQNWQADFDDWSNFKCTIAQSHEELLHMFVPSIKDCQCKLVLQAIRKLAYNESCNMNRNIYNTYKMLLKGGWKPQQLLLWLLHAINIMDCAERTYVICGKGWSIPTAI